MFDKLIDILLQFIQAFQFLAIVDQYERGIVLRLGKFHRRIGPGIHWVIPGYIEEVLTHEIVLSVRNLGAQTLQTLDNKKIVIGSMVTYTVSDVKKVLLRVEEAETVLENLMYGAITELVLANKFEDIKDAGFFIASLLERVTYEAKKLGLKIKQIALTDLAEVRTLRLIQDQSAGFDE